MVPVVIISCLYHLLLLLTVAVPVALVVDSDPVRAVLTVSNDPLGRSSWGAPGWLTVQEAIVLLTTQSDGHVSVALHAAHPMEALIS